MRCLHCGNTLSALKKLTDSGFCSTDHRDVFYADQQRLILERLRVSGQRFQRINRGSAATELRRPAPGTAAQVDQCPAPAPLSAFLYAKPENSDRHSPLLFFSVFLNASTLVFPPAPSRRTGRVGLFASLLSDFPWPRYNPGLKAFLGLLAVTDARTIGFSSSLRVNGFVSSNIEPGALLPPRQPDAASMVLARPFVLRMARPKPALALGPLNAPVNRRVFDLLLMSYLPPIELAAIDLPGQERVFHATPLESAALQSIADGVKLRSIVPPRMVCFLDRVYRMRPKTGSPSQDVPVMLHSVLEFLSSSATPLYPISATSSSLAIEPEQSIRFVRTRPRGPVQSETPLAISPNMLIEGLFSTPMWPTLTSTRSPQSLSALGSIEQLSIASVAPGPARRPELLTTADLNSQASPVHPDLRTSGISTGIPVAQFPSRSLPIGPGGPISSETGYIPSAPATPESLYSVPAICEMPRPELAAEPAAARQPFRMRPRSGVASPEITSLGPSTEAEPLQSGPAHPVAKLATTPAPVLSTRMFRMRPKAGVDVGPGLSNLPALESVAVPVCVATPGFPRGAGNPAPSLQERFFRVRPLMGVGAETAKSYESTAPLALDIRLEPAFGGMPATTAGDFAPALLDRPYRGRPKFALPSAECAFTEIVSTGNEPVELPPAIPGLPSHSTGLAPAINERFFRMRPRSGSGIETTRSYQGANLSLVEVKLDPAICGLAKEARAFAPAFVERMFHGRPKTGVTGGFAVYELATLSAEPLLSAPAVCSSSLAACEPASVLRLVRIRPKAAVNAPTMSHICAVGPMDFPASSPAPVPDWWDVLTGPKPIFMNRMYRMRLKQPAQDPATLSQEIRTKHLPVPDPEPVLATLPKSEPDAAPSFLDRLYRMRPKAGKTLAPAASAIPCNAIEPRSTSGAPAAALQSISRHWKSAPLAVKSIAATIPILLLILLLPFDLPTMAAADGAVREAIVKRSAVEHSDDFVGGLEHWQGVEKWKRFPSGAVQPVGLGLFTPSLEMRNYLLEFSAQIQKGGVGFVVRAADEKNYQAIKLVTLKAGPLPTVAIQRFALLDGKEVNRHQTILPVTVSADTVYRVSLDVNDQSFTLMVQGQVVDFWSEEQLKAGGAGFFSAKGEKALIQNIRMSHQADTIGKLFAALAL